jgi:hypothetical protein
MFPIEEPDQERYGGTNPDASPGRSMPVGSPNPSLPIHGAKYLPWSHGFGPESFS